MSFHTPFFQFEDFLSICIIQKGSAQKGYDDRKKVILNQFPYQKYIYLFTL